MPYSQIGGLTWREGEQVTLVMMSRMRNFASRLVVPRHHYSAARRLLREKIAAHDIHFTGKPLDLGLHDERDDV
jgi:transposase-like protein